MYKSCGPPMLPVFTMLAIVLIDSVLGRLSPRSCALTVLTVLTVLTRDPTIPAVLNGHVDRVGRASFSEYVYSEFPFSDLSLSDFVRH